MEQQQQQQQVEQRELVIKVKYGDTLRRIGAFVHGQLMDHNMTKLRAKITSLFKFSKDTDFILTYTDEDGDTVTLDDDDELRDAVIGQRLNPLRINVQLRSAGGSAAGSVISSPANISQPESVATLEQRPISTPEPLLDVVSNLIRIARKAASTSPKLAQKVDEAVKSEIFKVAKHICEDARKATSFPLLQVMEQLSNLDLSGVGQPSGATGELSGASSGTSARQADLNTGDEPKTIDVPILETADLSSDRTGHVGPTLKQNPADTVEKDAGVAVKSSADLKSDACRSPTASLYPLDDLLASIGFANNHGQQEKEIGSNSKLDGEPFPVAPVSPRLANLAGHTLENIWTPTHDYPAYMDTNIHLPTKFDASTSQSGLSFLPEIPTSKQLGAISLSDGFLPPWGCPAMHPYRRSHVHSENTSRTFHRGVQCDGCGMHPIVGPRFKSNVKEDYDLCNICFAEMGNERDYTRVDRAANRATRLLKDFHNKHIGHQLSPSAPCYGGRRSRVKLESRFIQDVTILDGTVMNPLTHFTKIWRMRNNGTVPWPFGTQLVWVGGDQFGDRVSTNLEIPPSGFPVDKELDIAVDFTAPSRPGRYVSYWKMASPSGQKFGQRVWILIQVEYSPPNSVSGNSSHAEFNLNLLPESTGHTGPPIIDMNAEPVENSFPETTMPGAMDALVNALAEDVSNRQRAEQAAQVVGHMLDACKEKQPPPTSVASSSAPHPLIDLQATPSAVDASPVPAVATDVDPVEQTMLKELEEMGFKQIDLNKEILRLNEYDMEQSVDDLCGFAEWDPLLIELQEMGFEDKELNKKMLIKNGGSIKRAVLDLIGGGKTE